MRSLREALGGIKRTPLLTGMASVMIGLSFFVTGIFGLVAHGLGTVLREAAEDVQVVVFLRDYARDQDIQRARAGLGELGSVAEVVFVSKEQALERARRDFPDFEEIFGSLEDANPLPRSLEVSLKDGENSAETAELVRSAALDYEFVEDADYGGDWVERLSSLRRVAALVAAILGTVFALVAGIITSSALRIVIFARRDEIYIMRLVGARDGYVRLPFLVEGGIVGMAGGLMALALTWAAHLFAIRFLFATPWLEPEWIGMGLAAAVAFGVASSAMAVRRRLGEPAG